MTNNIVAKKSWTDFIPICIIVASFGPHVFRSYGLRSDHLLIYSLLLFVVPIFIIRQRFIRWSPPTVGILVLLWGITIWTLGVSTFEYYPTVSFLKYLSSIENYTQPIAVIILVLVFVRHTLYIDFLLSFKHLCQCLIFMLCLNSVFAFCSIFFDLSNLMRPFVLSCFGDVSVSQIGCTVGRYSGIFNQPVENGLTYSLGLLSWGYLNRSSAKTGFIDYCILFILIIGGTLAVSKVFLFGGIPLLIVYLNPLGNFKKYFNWRFFLVAILGCCVILVIIRFWIGWDFISIYFKINSETNLISMFTGGRFGAENSSMSSYFAKVWNEVPLCGFGFGTVACYDNGYLEFFHQGGIIALFAYFALLGIYFWYSLRGFLSGYEEGRLLLAYFILTMGASWGSGVITANRFSPIFWVLTTFLFLMLQVRLREKVNETGLSWSIKKS